MAPPLILVDGSSWLYRAYHALNRPLSNSRGEPTGMVLVFGNMLRKLIKDHAPERIAVVFDPPGATFRNELYPAYKANRDETPEDLRAQFPAVRELIEGLGLPLLQVDKVEADDVIGTLAQAAGRRGMPVLIVTGDKDMAQLVDERIQLLDTMKNRRLDAAAVVEKFGVPPERMVDYLALVGDTSDNIPGVPMVGPKTAARWLEQYGSLEQLVGHAADVPGKAGENLRATLPKLPLYRELVTIRTDLELSAGLDDLKPGAPDTERLAALYRRLEFTRWLEELGASPGPRAEPSVASAPTRHETVLDAAAFDAMLGRLRQAALVCVDTETDSLDPMRARLVGLSFAVESGHGWYVPLAHEYLGAPRQLPAAEVLAKLRPLLEDPGRPKLGQHFKYDLNVLHRHGIGVQGVAFDTMLESYVLDAAGWRHDLDSMAEQHLGHRTVRFEDVAGKGKSQLTFNQVEVERAAAYAAEDADITLRLHQALYPRLRANAALLRVFETLEMPLVPVLARMERNGVHVDAALLARISGEMGERMERLQQQAWKDAGTEFNLASPPQLQEILYGKLELPVLAKTPKGQPSTAEEVLEELSEQHALPRRVLEWRALSKLRSTYADNLPQAIHPGTGRIHTSYHQAVAATGRLSSSDPNLQNIPVRTEEGRRIRQAFTAEPGHLLLSIDYSQIELRLMAHLSEDPRLQLAFRAGQDIHQATAAEVFGLPLDQVGADQRRAAKAINFGLMYGMSSFGLARQLGISRTDAQAYMDTFFARYPGVREFMDGTRERARRDGFVETLFGRRLYLKEIRSRNAAQRQYAERTAINAPLQGTAADLIKLAMIQVQGFLDREAPEVLMIMQVHDELVFEGPEKAVRKLAPELAQRMCRVASLAVPLVADWGTGTQWDQAHATQGQARQG